MRAYVRAYVRACVRACVRVCVCVCACACVYLCGCLSVCMCLSVYMCDNNNNKTKTKKGGREVEGGLGGGIEKVVISHAHIHTPSMFLEYACPDGIFQSRVRLNRSYAVIFFHE